MSNRKKDNQRRYRRSVGRIFRVAVFCCLWPVLLSGRPAAAVNDAPDLSASGGIDQTREELEKWVETQRIISQEKKDWKLGREMLEEQIKVMEREIDSLQAKIKEAQDSITETDESRSKFIDENEEFKKATSSLSGIVRALEYRTRELLQRLPSLVRDRVQPLSQRIPENAQDTELSLGERFQNVIGILNEINKFNGEISVASEVRDLPDGSSVEVTALYVGISQGYYTNSDGTVAGIGSASDDQWVWTPANDAGPGILQAIAIMKNEAAASFVRLPVKIQ